MTPIRASERPKYPRGKAWSAIRDEVIAREGGRCKFCRVRNYAIVDKKTRAHYWVDYFTYAAAERGRRVAEIVDTHSIVVLTIAHLDHDPTNNGTTGDRPNLAALCQKCHNNHDAAHRASTRKATKESKTK